MCVNNEIREWYKQFLRLAEQEGVDINAPESANMFHFISLSSSEKVQRGVKNTEWRDDPVPISAPYEEGTKHVDDPLWVFSNSRPIAQMNDKQIKMLYDKAQEGFVAFNFVNSSGSEPRLDHKIIYTGDDLLPHFSGSINRLPDEETLNETHSGEMTAEIRDTFPQAADPEAMALRAARYLFAGAFVNLGFAMKSEEIDRRSVSTMCLSQLYQDRKLHPDYYENKELSEERAKLIFSSAFHSVNNREMKMSKEEAGEKSVNFSLTSGVEEHILSISTAGKSLSEMISEKLIRRSDGTAYTKGDKPWSVSEEMTKDLLAGKTIEIFRSGRTKDAPVESDGTLIFPLPVKDELRSFKETRSAESQKKKDLEKSDAKKFSGVQAHETVYGGLRVMEDQKKEIEKQPVADMLTFTKNGDGSYQMASRLPEMITTENGKDVRYRQTMNYFLRGLSRLCLDRDGNFDPTNYIKFREMTKEWNGKKKSADFAKALGIPSEFKEDFSELASNWDVMMTTVDGSFDSSIEYVRMFQTGLADLYKKGSSVDPVKEKLLRESYPDFQRRISRIREMASMDPEKEMRMLSYMDCGCSASTTNMLLPMVNAYREKKNLPAINGERKTIYFDPKHEHPDDPERGYYNAFAGHVVFLYDVKVNGQPVKLSAETTAPKTGKLMFAGEKGENALGFYRDMDELSAYHTKDGYYHVDNFETYSNIAGVKMENAMARPDSRVRQNAHILETKMRLAVTETSHTAAELSKRLNSSKVDHPMKPSSSEFKIMKNAFEKLENARTLNERTTAITQLNIAAQAYLDYKEPKGDMRKEKALSDYARRRLEFAHDVLEYTSAMLNRAGIKPTVVPETRLNPTLQQQQAVNARAAAAPQNEMPQHDAPQNRRSHPDAPQIQ